MSATSTQYCMLVIKNTFLSSDKDIYVDFGRQNSSLISGNSQVINDAVQVKQFVTIIDGLNYMASLGWEVVHLTPFETDTDGGTYDTYRYLLKRSL
jgi:hypothetical protein